MVVMLEGTTTSVRAQPLKALAGISVRPLPRVTEASDEDEANAFAGISVTQLPSTSEVMSVEVIFAMSTL